MRRHFRYIGGLWNNIVELVGSDSGHNRSLSNIKPVKKAEETAGFLNQAYEDGRSDERDAVAAWLQKVETTDENCASLIASLLYDFAHETHDPRRDSQPEPEVSTTPPAERVKRYSKSTADYEDDRTPFQLWREAYANDIVTREEYHAAFPVGDRLRHWTDQGIYTRGQAIGMALAAEDITKLEAVMLNNDPDYGL